MKLATDIKPVTYLKTHTAEVIRRVSSGGPPLVITHNGEAKAVVVGVEEYDRWRESWAMMRVVAQGRADVRAGRVLSTEEVAERARAMLAGREDG